MAHDAQALLESARSDLKKGFTVRAGTRFRQAADLGEPNAIVELAQCILERRIPGKDTEIRNRLENFSNLTAELLRMRYSLRYRGIGGPADLGGALLDLNSSAEHGHPLSVAEIIVLWNELDSEQAVTASRTWMSYLRRLPDISSTELGDLLESSNGPELAGVTSPPPPLETWPRIQGQATKRIHLSREPEIYTLSNVLSPFECAWLREMARPHLATSKIHDPVTGKTRSDPVRTSDAMYFNPGNISPVIVRTIEKILLRVNRSPETAEPLAVLRYMPDQEYKPHYDWLSDTSLARDPLRQTGQRIATVLVYLNTPESGGHTSFPRLDLEIPAKQGDLLFFSNVDAQGQPDRATLHAGTPVMAGEKWISSLWLREHKIQL